MALAKGIRLVQTRWCHNAAAIVWTTTAKAVVKVFDTFTADSDQDALARVQSWSSAGFAVELWQQSQQVRTASRGQGRAQPEA